MKYNPLLMIDFYKAVHSEQYPKGMTRIYSPYTPRMSRLNDCDHVTYVGGQGFDKEMLIETFNNHFFNLPEAMVVYNYDRVLHYTLGPGTYNPEKIVALHRLGYLPIAHYAVPEGTRTKIGVPQSVFVNTHPDFAWLTNTLETAFSSYMWHIQVSAEVGVRYRNIVDKYREMTCDDSVRTASVLGDFSMRGQHSPESAMRSSAAWLLSFRNTATVPAIMWLEDYYNCNIENEEVGFGAVSFEHSTVTSNYALDGNEETLLKRALTEIYPNSNFSFLTDSYDHHNFLRNVVPACKDEILAHNGTVLFRGDSGDPVEIIAGKNIHHFTEEDEIEIFKSNDEDDIYDLLADYCYEYGIKSTFYFKVEDKYYEGVVDGYTYYDCEGPDFTIEDIEWHEVEPSLELLGMIWHLDQIFGSTINSKGYKVLNSHVKGIYGDSMTPSRVQTAYHRLEQQGYAINNVVFGVGSFSFMCLEDADGKMNPYTRDTFGIAIKATYGEDKDGNPVMIYKQPKECAWKKSQKGCVIVAPDGESYTDGHTFDEATAAADNLLQLVFKDGKMVKEQSLAEIRQRMWGNF